MNSHSTTEQDFDEIDRWLDRIIEDLQAGMLAGVDAA